jgi:hypothetical protein
MGCVVNAKPLPLYPRETPGPIVQKAGWAPGPVWTGAENLAPTGIRSPEFQSRLIISIWLLNYVKYKNIRLNTVA